MKALLAILLFLPLLARPDALDDFCQAQFAAGNHNATAVHAALMERAVVVGVTNRARNANLVQDEVDFLALVRAQPSPLIGTNTWAATAQDERAELVQRRIERRILDSATVAPQNAAVVLRAKLDILERRILARGGNPYADQAGASTEDVPTQTRAQPLWKILGLPRAPTPAEVRAALKPAP